MPTANVYSRSVSITRFGRTLAMVGSLSCCALNLTGQTQNAALADQPDKSWTAITNLQSGDLLPTRIPVQIIESHSQDGTRTTNKRTVQVRGVDGRLTPYQEIETESVQVDPTTVRTTTRTFGRDVNGARSLIQLTEEEHHSLPGGESTIQRTTFNTDVNGKLQPVQREIVETRALSAGVQETNTIVMLPNINDGLVSSYKAREVSTQTKNGSVESKKTTMLTDGAGNWGLAETRDVSSAQEGANRTTDVRISRRDAEGKLSAVSRVVSQQSTGSSGEQLSTVTTYSVDVPGATRDGKLHLVERTSTSNTANASGVRSTEQKLEQLNPGDPAAGPRLSILVDGKTVTAASGEQSTTTIRWRDSNDSFGIVSVDTSKSSSLPTLQIP